MGLSDESLVTIRFSTLAKIVAFCPTIALVLCILTSMFLHWELVTSTHCNVYNFLPSVSAAIATYNPEKYIWRFLIAIHITPRYIFAFANRNLLIKCPLRPSSRLSFFSALCNLSCILNILEITFLLLLTTISSTDDHFLHKCSFIGFITTAMIHMYLSTWLYNHSNRRRVTNFGEKIYQKKVLSSILCTLSLSLAMYFYWRHNTYCEAGIYTLFALSDRSKKKKNNKMVFFACDNCGESLKKNAVEKHIYRCKNATYSCMDCQKSFDKFSYSSHLKCISEEERYGGKNYVVKENKGEKKQNAWCEQVTKAIENVKEKDLKDILKQVSKFDNIPRKEAKFLNFLNNSLKIKNRGLCERAWKAIEVEAIKMREEAIAKSEEAKLKAKEEKEAKEKAKEEENCKEDIPDEEVTEKKSKKKNKRVIKYYPYSRNFFYYFLNYVW
ncbi:Post-GPI attachment to proteins factor 2 [Strongyloides ratti]|uniref:Post-GPI attachment to proteins factor 2 n=1 Tax=Strongyloides ratti TaxID=34506 RepID=A0A090LA10_STRRB|nr:Post-GPI attachment to proteins factor 2 [Strongyloides ratti]CEF64978.1 Post-GPI attachment to proteins factor 2 [Strongyloides ratti]